MCRKTALTNHRASRFQLPSSKIDQMVTARRMNKKDLSRGPAPPGWSNQKEGKNAVVAKTRVSSVIDGPQRNPNPSSRPIRRASESLMSPCSDTNLSK
ncbi:hypothetical protein NDU88_001112 [Pleurodeles waltl]|uniref:Uncharacterized protein n=1 Tax=Pleurodeles waltl TaxID=8319 RepID=A0AAV7WKZ2_PLEWA|nr:hypothetical protein NDU88_001112 [Pleurodeles waltl]